MGYKFVFDANVPICLDEITFLKETLQFMEELEDTIFMNSLNLYEIKTNDIRQTLKESPVCTVIEHDEDAYRNFRSKMLKPARIAANKEDNVVLQTDYMTAADYLVSSDFGVINRAYRFRKFFNLEYMEPLTPVRLLEYLHSVNVIECKVFLEKSLTLFKVHELGNLHRGIKNEGWTELDVRKRFQSYKGPIIESINEVVQ
ncbi:MAG: hypothetical protein HXS48_08060 [Theionarchaea archaeon]|nr:hypothetical protein [Theionarchaea archaeon]